jgi:cytochrome d ubiquinol oxidase subunit II
MMLMGLIFRGVAFSTASYLVPDVVLERGFPLGLGVAAFSQGIMLGQFIEGSTYRAVLLRTTADWVSRSMVAGAALVFGYGLLGAGWLVIRRKANSSLGAAAGRRMFLGVVAFVAMSLY